MVKEAIFFAARQMGKDLSKSRNFGEEWDLSRFVLALEKMKDKKKLEGLVFFQFQNIFDELKKWRTVRNGYSHLGFSGSKKDDKKGEGWEEDEDLGKRILEARYLISHINSMKIGSRGMKRLEKKLRELALQVGLEDDLSSEVKSLESQQTNDQDDLEIVGDEPLGDGVRERVN